jgi:hypothetical protein
MEHLRRLESNPVLTHQSVTKKESWNNRRGPLIETENADSAVTPAREDHGQESAQDGVGRSLIGNHAKTIICQVRRLFSEYECG